MPPGEQYGVLDWSSDGDHVVAVSQGSGSATVFDRSGNEVGALPDVGVDVTPVDFSPDGDLIATIDGYGSERDGSSRPRLPAGSPGKVVARSPRTAARSPSYHRRTDRDGGSPRELRRRERRLVVEFPLHLGDVEGIAFSQDGRRLAVVAIDASIRMFDSESGEELLLLYGNRGASEPLAFSPDGSMLASVGDDGLRIWALDIDDLLVTARDKVTRSLTDEECRRYSQLDSCTNG